MPTDKAGMRSIGAGGAAHFSPAEKRRGRWFAAAPPPSSNTWNEGTPRCRKCQIVPRGTGYSKLPPSFPLRPRVSSLGTAIFYVDSLRPSTRRLTSCSYNLRSRVSKRLRAKLVRSRNKRLTHPRCFGACPGSPWEGSAPGWCSDPCSVATDAATLHRSGTLSR